MQEQVRRLPRIAASRSKSGPPLSRTATHRTGKATPESVDSGVPVRRGCVPIPGPLCRYVPTSSPLSAVAPAGIPHAAAPFAATSAVSAPRAVLSPNGVATFPRVPAAAPGHPCRDALTAPSLTFLLDVASRRDAAACLETPAAFRDSRAPAHHHLRQPEHSGRRVDEAPPLARAEFRDVQRSVTRRAATNTLGSSEHLSRRSEDPSPMASSPIRVMEPPLAATATTGCGAGRTCRGASQHRLR